MKEQYVIEFAVEMVDGSIRFESFECKDMRGVSCVVRIFKVNDGETVVHFNCQIVQTLF